MKTGTKVAIGVGAALVAGLAAGKASAAPASGSPSLPATLPDGSKLLPGAVSTWWYLSTTSVAGGPLGALFYADTVTAMILADAAAQQADPTQLANLKLYAQANGVWKEIQRH